MIYSRTMILALFLTVIIVIAPSVADQGKEDTYKIKEQWRGKHQVKEDFGELSRVVYLSYATGDPDRDGAKDAYLLQGYHWTSFPVTYTINYGIPVNKYKLRKNAVISAVKDTFESWDIAVDLDTSKNNKVYSWKGQIFCIPLGYTSADPINLFSNSPSIGTSGKASLSKPDYKNVITWGMISDQNIIAMSSVWYNPATGKIVDADIIYNSDYRWGIDADGERSVSVLPSNTYDIRNVGTHEVGHFCGLGDLYEPKYSAMTMYGYTKGAETSHMSLEPGDVAGVRALY